MPRGSPQGRGHVARRERIDRIVALDDFDVETAALLREHLRCRAWARRRRATSATSWRCAAGAQRLACSCRPSSACSTTTRSRDYLDRVAGPWLVKPRSQAAAIGIRKSTRRTRCGSTSTTSATCAPFYAARAVRARRHLPRRLDRLGPRGGVRASRPLRLAADGRWRTRGYLHHAAPSTRVGRGAGAAGANARLLDTLGLVRGVTHTEFIRAQPTAAGISWRRPRVSAARSSSTSSRRRPASTCGTSGRRWRWRASMAATIPPRPRRLRRPRPVTGAAGASGHVGVRRSGDRPARRQAASRRPDRHLAGLRLASRR